MVSNYKVSLAGLECSYLDPRIKSIVVEVKSDNIGDAAEVYRLLVKRLRLPSTIDIAKKLKYPPFDKNHKETK